MRGQRRHVPTVLLAVLALAPLGCGILEGEPDMREQLDDARRLWAAQGVADYDITVLRLCGECLDVWTRPYRVSVRDGVVLTVVDEQTGTGAPLDYGRTVERLFDFVQETLDRDPWRISVTYDASWGFPATVSVDYDKEAVDDEVVLRARDLTPLP